MINKKRKFRWAIIDDKGNIIMKFHYKLTALGMLPQIKNNKLEKLNIVKL